MKLTNQEYLRIKCCFAGDTIKFLDYFSQLNEKSFIFSESKCNKGVFMKLFLKHTFSSVCNGKFMSNLKFTDIGKRVVFNHFKFVSFTLHWRPRDIYYLFYANGQLYISSISTDIRSSGNYNPPGPPSRENQFKRKRFFFSQWFF